MGCLIVWTCEKRTQRKTHMNDFCPGSTPNDVVLSISFWANYKWPTNSSSTIFWNSFFTIFTRQSSAWDTYVWLATATITTNPHTCDETSDFKHKTTRELNDIPDIKILKLRKVFSDNYCNQLTNHANLRPAQICWLPRKDTSKRITRSVLEKNYATYNYWLSKTSRMWNVADSKKRIRNVLIV